MKWYFLSAVIICIIFLAACSGSKESVNNNESSGFDPDTVKMGPKRHENLSNELLARIKSITDVFEEVDGISYAMALDSYKRDINPESEIVIFEAMLSAYNEYLEQNANSALEEKKEVYVLLLMATMYEKSEVLDHVQLEHLDKNKALVVINSYHLDAQPIQVVSH